MRAAGSGPVSPLPTRQRTGAAACAPFAWLVAAPAQPTIARAGMGCANP